ncbi:MAG: hypothetical protein ABSE69_05070 [Roseiarcus sp.]
MRDQQQNFLEVLALQDTARDALEDLDRLKLIGNAMRSFAGRKRQSKDRRDRFNQSDGFIIACDALQDQRNTSNPHRNEEPARQWNDRIPSGRSLRQIFHHVSASVGCFKLIPPMPRAARLHDDSHLPRAEKALQHHRGLDKKHELALVCRAGKPRHRIFEPDSVRASAAPGVTLRPNICQQAHNFPPGKQTASAG